MNRKKMATSNFCLNEACEVFDLMQYATYRGFTQCSLNIMYSHLIRGRGWLHPYYLGSSIAIIGGRAPHRSESDGTVLKAPPPSPCAQCLDLYLGTK